jgi:hypothetical protein
MYINLSPFVSLPLLKNSTIAVVAFLPSPNQQMMSQFQLDRLPTFIVMYPQGDDDTADAKGGKSKGIQFGMAKFDPRRYGKPTYETVSSFTIQVAVSVNPESVQKLMQEKEAEAEASAAAGSISSSSSGNAGPVSEVTFESWTRLCDSRSSKLCAIAFLSNGESSSTFHQELETAQVNV